MTSGAPLSISEAAVVLGRHNIEAGFVIPTATGLGKSIMDATWPLREYLARTAFHDYTKQGQGRDSKRVVPVEIIQAAGDIQSEMSLYRPETKDGDPRLWIYGLTKFAEPDDLIAIIVDEGKIYVVNCIRENLTALLNDAATTLGRISTRLDKYSGVAAKLLLELKDIGRRGFVPSLRPGDTGVGFTLESLLKIKANSSQMPDYEGKIELKSARTSRLDAAKARHVTLFSKIPNWEKSPFAARQTLETFGYRDAATNRLQLFCSIDAKQPNTQGFSLKMSPEADSLVNSNNKRVPGGEDVFLWVMESLRQSFAKKHRETFWIKALTRKEGGVEHFHFIEARHTRKPPLATFERLLAEGGICVDLTMSEKGASAVRDHGYLFRIYGNRFDELFPEVGTYSLVA